MLRNVNDKKILHALDPESRRALAFSASIMLAFDRKLCVDEAVCLVCKVFAAVYAEQADATPKKSE